MGEARQAGINVFLAKPVRQSALYDCLVSVMAGQVKASDVPPLQAELSLAEVQQRDRGRLLLAEDNAVNQEVALGILELEGYQVMTVNNGQEALDAFLQFSFDLILMDCHMPDMDGFAATRKIREIEKNTSHGRIPIIALTANAMQQDRDECLNAGMDDYLSKPYSRQQMRAMLNTWLVHKVPAATAAQTPAASAPPKPNGEILDRAALDGIRALQTDGGPNVLKRVIDLYLDDAPKLIQRLKYAVAAEDAPEIERAAHTLKSTSASLGALKLAQLCKELETSARLNSPAKAKQIFSEFEAAYNGVRVALTEERSASPDDGRFPSAKKAAGAGGR